ncbi:hypothetical protein C8039_03300 [Halogeometricum sp. wsp3]|nr:hypothetical protein C8039_03300 [Halogeometricum sp. wsp3]
MAVISRASRDERDARYPRARRLHHRAVPDSGRSELWNVGFDTERVAEGTLSELERDNVYTIRSRESVDLEDYYDLLQNIDSAKRLVDGCRELSEVERNTLEKSRRRRLLRTPRDATLSSLAEEFDVPRWLSRRTSGAVSGRYSTASRRR